MTAVDPRLYASLDVGTEDQTCGVVMNDEKEITDFWTWSPEVEEHARKVLAHLGIPESFMTNEIEFASSVALSNSLKLHAMELDFDLKTWIAKWRAIKRRFFKPVRSASARARKARRSYRKWPGIR